jgi:hypothetical protein
MLAALLVIVFAAGQFVVPALPGLLGFGSAIAQATTAGPAPETPSGPAFGIWGLLFTLSVLYALRQALPSRRETHVYQSIRAAALGAFALSCAWMATAQFYGNGLALVGIIWAMLGCSVIAFRRLLAMRGTLDGFDRWLTLPLFGLLSGWLSAAVMLNTSSWLRLINALPAGWSPSLVAAAVLLAVGALAVVLLQRSNASVWYGAAVLWALGWVVHANIMVRPNREVATLAVGLMLVVVAVLVWSRRPVRQTDRIS